MSPPEVEPLVCRRYEIKRRLGKGVSAWRGWPVGAGSAHESSGARVEFRAP